MTTILVPVDLSEVSEAVVKAAAALARAFQARLVVLYVIPPAVMTSELSAHMGDPDPGQGPNVDEVLGNFQEDLAAQGIESECVQEFGPPIDTILEQAGKFSAEYIVMGSHRHTAIHNLFVGSTTAGVLKRARSPVLVVRAA